MQQKIVFCVYKLYVGEKCESKVDNSSRGYKNKWLFLNIQIGFNLVRFAVFLKDADEIQ